MGQRQLSPFRRNKKAGRRPVVPKVTLVLAVFAATSVVGVSQPAAAAETVPVTTLASVGPSSIQGNADSKASMVSADGRYVVFSSDATNLVAGDANGKQDVFLRDLESGTTVAVSPVTTADGASTEPSISADGRFVAFTSEAVRRRFTQTELPPSTTTTRINSQAKRVPQER